MVYSCEREYNFLGENVEAVSTTEIINIAKSTALVKASLNTTNGSAVYDRGVCYSTKTNPTTNDSKLQDNSDPNSIGVYEITLQNLNAGTKYYVRAYAQNSNGTAYGKELSFTTLAPSLAVISTNSITNITQTTALSGGSISDNGGSSVSERGIVYSSSSNLPTTNNTKVISGGGSGNFNSSLISLTPGTTYYVRAYAINVAGISYGSVLSFTTVSVTLPSSVTTNAATNVTGNSANISASVLADGGGTITSRGFVYSSTSSTPMIGTSSSINSGTGVGVFNSSITALQPNTTYYIRAFATNSAGTAYGNTRSFTTLNLLAVGQPYNGGIIGYIFQPGEPGYVSGQVHGLIIPTVTGQTYQWGCSGTNISTSLSLGYGNSNTNNIVSACSSSSTAARYAYNLSSGGYSDWFLPSYYELLKISESGYLLNLMNTSYWTSSQSSSTSAYTVNARTGSTSTFTKTSSLYVLPVRQF